MDGKVVRQRGKRVKSLEEMTTLPKYAWRIKCSDLKIDPPDKPITENGIQDSAKALETSTILQDKGRVPKVQTQHQSS